MDEVKRRIMNMAYESDYSIREVERAYHRIITIRPECKDVTLLWTLVKLLCNHPRVRETRLSIAYLMKHEHLVNTFTRVLIRDVQKHKWINSNGAYCEDLAYVEVMDPHMAYALAITLPGTLYLYEYLPLRRE